MGKAGKNGSVNLDYLDLRTERKKVSPSVVAPACPSSP